MTHEAAGNVASLGQARLIGLGWLTLQRSSSGRAEVRWGQIWLRAWARGVCGHLPLFIQRASLGRLQEGKRKHARALEDQAQSSPGSLLQCAIDQHKSQACLDSRGGEVGCSFGGRSFVVTLPRGADAGKGTVAPFLLTVYPRYVGALSKTQTINYIW